MTDEQIRINKARNNGTYPAFPAGSFSTNGLTKREYIAIHLLAGMMANPNFTDAPDSNAITCIQQADSLLFKLENEPK